MKELRDEELASGTCATRMTRRTFDFQEGMCLGLRAGEFAWRFQVVFRRKALERKLQAKVCPTRHTRPTPELNPRAKLH